MYSFQFTENVGHKARIVAVLLWHGYYWRSVSSFYLDTVLFQRCILNVNNIDVVLCVWKLMSVPVDLFKSLHV